MSVGTFVMRTVKYGGLWLGVTDASLLALKAMQETGIPGWDNNGGVFNPRSVAISVGYCAGIASTVAAAREMHAPVWASLLVGVGATVVGGKLMANVMQR